MAEEKILEELRAPDQFGVLVTCIFLNKTKAVKARPFLDAFLEAYPTAQSLQGVKSSQVKAYFDKLGLQKRRARWIVEMANQLLSDPPRPYALRQKTYDNAPYPSEVGHLSGIGEYGSDAWRLFCKERFYADAGYVVEDEWRTLEPNDKALKGYVERRKREEAARQAANFADEITKRMGGLDLAKQQVSSTRSAFRRGIVVGDGDHKLLIPWKILDKAETLGTPAQHKSRTTIAVS